MSADEEPTFWRSAERRQRYSNSRCKNFVFLTTVIPAPVPFDAPQVISRPLTQCTPVEYSLFPDPIPADPRKSRAQGVISAALRETPNPGTRFHPQQFPAG